MFIYFSFKYLLYILGKSTLFKSNMFLEAIKKNIDQDKFEKIYSLILLNNLDSWNGIF